MAAPSISQDPEPRTPGYTDRIAVEWVSVAAIVEPENRPLPKLEPDHFRLFVDGREVRVEEFEPSGEIVHLIYLQDVSGSMGLRRRMEISKAVYRRMVDQLWPGDEIALATFAAPELVLRQPFTSDLELLAGLERDWSGWGETALLDAASAIPELARAQWGRTTALLVTDGVDNASDLPAEEVRRLLSSAGIPLYVFGLEGADPGDDRAVDPEKDPSATGSDFATEAELRDLRSLAAASGGRYVNLTETSVELAVSRILRDIRGRVFLGFPTRTDSARSLHEVEVRLRRDGVIHHRTHYYGHEPRSWAP